MTVPILPNATYFDPETRVAICGYALSKDEKTVSVKVSEILGPTLASPIGKQSLEKWTVADYLGFLEKPGIVHQLSFKS